MTLGKCWSSLCQVFVHISVVLCLCLHSFCLRACFSKLDKVFIMWLAKYVPNGDLTRGATETGGCWDLLLCNREWGREPQASLGHPLGSLHGCGRARLCFPLPQRSPFAWLGWRLLAGSAPASSTPLFKNWCKLPQLQAWHWDWDWNRSSVGAARGARSPGGLFGGSWCGNVSEVLLTFQPLLGLELLCSVACSEQLCEQL